MSQSYSNDPTSPEAGERLARMRAHFRSYFAGEAQGRGLLRFRNHVKRATLWLGAILWFLTIPISFYEGYRTVRTGLPETPTLQVMAAVGGIIFAGSILVWMAASDGLWKEVLHNFSRYFVLLVVGPALLIVAWYFHTQGLELWRNGVGALAAILIIASFFIGSKPPPDEAEIEAALDDAFEADLRRHLARVLADLRGSGAKVPDKVGADATFCVLRRFPLESELAGRELMAQPARDDRPRITPQGFTALIFEAGSILSCEGAIDLPTGALTAHRVCEFAPGDIDLLSLIAAGVAYDPPQEKVMRPRRGRLQMPAMAAARPAPSYRTSLSIGLPGNARIDVVLRDGAALAKSRTFAGIPANEIAPLTDWDFVRRTWQILAALRHSQASG